MDQPEDLPGGRPVRRPPRTVAVTADTLRVAVVAGALAVAAGVVWWVTGRPAETAVAHHPDAGAPVPAVPEPTASDASPAPGALTSPSATVLVDVRGGVNDPGVQRLPAGSRVIDAVRAAGGLRPGKGYGTVNLAAVLVDGQQVRVGGAAAGQPPAGTAPTAVPGQPQAGLIDLNTATAADLETLDGIGPVLAGQIVQWREANGPFQTVEDLLDVSGIGEATLAGLRDQVTVG